MGLLGGLYVGEAALQAQRLALEVTGNNIANANTPGYARRRVLMAPGVVQEIRPGVEVGSGVWIEGVRSAVDQFLEERLRHGIASTAEQETRETGLLRLEGLFDALSDSDLSTALSEFFNSIQDLQNRPDDAAMRQLAVERGRVVTDTVRFLRDRIDEFRTSANGQVSQIGQRINQITDSVAELNVRIAGMEGGGEGVREAGALRTQRHVLLTELAELIDIRVIETDAGSVNVYAGSDFLVYEKVARQVEEVHTTDRGVTITNLRFADDGQMVTPNGGKLGGAVTLRDTDLAGYVDDLDTLAGSLVFEFNKVFSQGQGLTGYDSLTGTYSLDDPTAALNQAGLSFTPQNGSFDIIVRNTTTGTASTTNITVDLDGLGADTTLNTLAAALNAVSGVNASVTVGNELQISAASSDLELRFGTDTSGALAALGINTFFNGSASDDIRLNDTVGNDSRLFAAAKSDSTSDVSNAVDMVAFQDANIDGLGQRSVREYLDGIVQRLAGESALAQVQAESLRTFRQTLTAEREQYSGVSLDEEAVNLMNFQRAFQAAARYITTIDRLLETVMSM